MSSSPLVRYSLHGSKASLGYQQPVQVLEVRLNYFTRFVVRSPPVFALPHQRYREYPSYQVHPAVLYLPLRQLEDPFFCQHYVAQLLSSLGLSVPTCELLAPKITSFIIELAEGNYEWNQFAVVADIDFVRIFWAQSLPMTMDDDTVILEVQDETGPMPDVEEPATRGAPKSAIRRLKNEKFVAVAGEKLGECSVCYDELCGGKELIRMPCNHMYHQSCIIQWLKKRNSCPLCRSPVQFED